MTMLKNFLTTEEISVPSSLAEQVLGQEHAVEVIRQAAKQKRFVLIVGEPGTGKSMLGRALAEFLPVSELEDVLVFPNLKDKTLPKIQVVKAGEGEKIVKENMQKKNAALSSMNFLFNFIMAITILISLYYSFWKNNSFYFLGGMVFLAALLYLKNQMLAKSPVFIPRLLVDNTHKNCAPFIDATGSHEGSLLGDVRHDPFQSGGSEAPPHELIEAGAIHRANHGVLYIDEVSTFSIESQQQLLTAIQEKELPITGRSSGSFGAMVRTDPVPCDFVLVLAGNLQDVKKMHPALRSRIRGYGYEIYTKTMMDDTEENRFKMAQFVAQEIRRDGKIPHFTREAVDEIIDEARKKTKTNGKLTLRLREVGGLVRIAGDVAVKENASGVQAAHVLKAKILAKTIEEQMQEEQHASFVEQIQINEG